jgi:hypothetical protein
MMPIRMSVYHHTQSIGRLSLWLPRWIHGCSVRLLGVHSESVLAPLGNTKSLMYLIAACCKCDRNSNCMIIIVDKNIVRGACGPRVIDLLNQTVTTSEVTMTIKERNGPQCRQAAAVFVDSSPHPFITHSFAFGSQQRTAITTRAASSCATEGSQPDRIHSLSRTISRTATRSPGQAQRSPHYGREEEARMSALQCWASAQPIANAALLASPAAHCG